MGQRESLYLEWSRQLLLQHNIMSVQLVSVIITNLYIVNLLILTLKAD